MIAHGVIFIDFSLVFKAFREHQRFCQNTVSGTVLDPTWLDLTRFWLPKWSQNESQNGTQNDQKSCSILRAKKSENSAHKHTCNKWCARNSQNRCLIMYYLVPSTWYQVVQSKYMVPRTWYQVRACPSFMASAGMTVDH